MNPILEKLWPALAESGVAFAQADRDTILGLADGIADEWLDKVVTAIASNLPSGGVKNAEWGPVKNALLSSEPQIDQASNDAIGRLFDRIIATLKTVSGG